MTKKTIKEEIFEEYANLLRKTVMAAFDNKEFVSNWERLRGKKLHGEKAMKLFIKDAKNLIFDRLPLRD